MGRLNASRRTFLLGAGALALAGCTRAKALDADVIVLGAGLAGLNAALLLEENGLRTIVVEADSRVGGRARTLDDAAGKPDAGGQEIGPLYGRTRFLIERFGLALAPGPSREDPIRYALAIGGEVVKFEDWAKATANKLSGALHEIAPMRLESTLLGKAAEIPPGDAWLDPAHAHLDRPYGAYLAELGADPEALRLIAAQGPLDSLDGLSALWMLKRRAKRSQSAQTGAVEFLAGGMSRLPEAMAGGLKGGVRLNAPVTAIETDAREARVHTADGKIVRARRIISTLPLSTLREVRIDPLPPAAQAEAIAAIPYGQATSVFIPVKAPFWEEDGLGNSMWTDGDLGRVMRWRNPSGTHLWVFMTGANGRRARTSPPEEVAAFAKTEIERLRPAAKGRIEDGVCFCWSRHPWVKGTFAFRGPGQISRLEAALAAPHGRLHFAGEHTARAESGLEGALESGERAAFEVMQAA